MCVKKRTPQLIWANHNSQHRHHLLERDHRYLYQNLELLLLNRPVHIFRKYFLVSDPLEILYLTHGQPRKLVNNNNNNIHENSIYKEVYNLIVTDSPIKGSLLIKLGRVYSLFFFPSWCCCKIICRLKDIITVCLSAFTIPLLDVSRQSSETSVTLGWRIIVITRAVSTPQTLRCSGFLA